MPRKHWPLLVVLGFQVGVLAAIVGEQVLLRATGRPVSLRTVPIDPYDMLSGYHLVLGYEVEEQATARRPAGVREKDAVWLTLSPGDEAWDLYSVSVERPAPVAGRVSMRAQWTGGRVRLRGAGRLYLPEAERHRAERLFDEAGSRAIADLRVGADGRPALERLRIGRESFGE